MITLRKTHRYLGLLIALPLSVMVLTGLLLQLRNQFEWIQPKTLTLSRSDKVLLSLEEIQSIFPEQIEQIIYRPLKNSLSLRLSDGREVQLHPETGEVLKVAPRRTGWLIDLHQGSWLGHWGQYGVHLVAGIGLFYLIISGLLIWPLRRRK